MAMACTGWVGQPVRQAGKHARCVTLWAQHTWTTDSDNTPRCMSRVSLLHRLRVGCVCNSWGAGRC